MPAQAANVVALLVTAIANTAANRPLHLRRCATTSTAGATTPGASGVFAIALGLTSGSLAALQALAPTRRGRRRDAACSSSPTPVATVARFLLYRSWVFPRRGGATASPTTPLAADRDDALEEVSR